MHGEGTFDVEHIDVMFGHHVEYSSSVSRLPIWELQGTKERQLNAKEA